MHKNHIWMMVACFAPLLLIFILSPALGIDGIIGIFVIIILMFAFHLLMLKHHGGNNHEHTEQQSKNNKQEKQ